MREAPIALPDALVPEWERRFRAARIGMPRWAADAPDHCVVVATVGGVVEVHCWDHAAGRLTQVTGRPAGTLHCDIDPAGEWVWWFDDESGNERGVWRRQPFGSGPEDRAEDVIGLPPAYRGGLALGRGGLIAVDRTDDSGSHVYVTRPGERAQLLYQHREDAWVGALSADGTLLALVHSENGDSRHPELRVLRVADGEVVGELSDGRGRGLEPVAFAPAPGDQRLLVRHERQARAGLLVWDPADGTRAELALGGGEVAHASWWPDGGSVLAGVDYEARTRMRLIRLDEAGLRPIGEDAVGPATGTVLDAGARPGGGAWLLWSSAAQASTVRDLAGDVVLAPPGKPAPPSVPVEDVWVDGPGGRVHALLRRPAGDPAGPLPLVVEVHGGPRTHDTDAYRAGPSAWVNHGFAVVQVNYRGSTGYGLAWRDALEATVGHVELEDIVAVRDHLVATGVADPDQVVLSGTSWGGYLTLLGVGVYPSRWAVGLASVPVADYVAAYEDEMESLKAFDRALFGGSPAEAPDKYRRSSPLTYVGDVRAAVLILAGRNDPRCPIRQVENYARALAGRDAPHEIYRYDAGHGSLVDDERIRQARAKFEFVRRHLGGPA
jgi:dipeptidyl aminopeptidase/acylaminoacyl peptidase